MRSVTCEVLVHVDFSKELDFVTWRNIHDNIWYELYLSLTSCILDCVRIGIEIQQMRRQLFTA